MQQYVMKTFLVYQYLYIYIYIYIYLYIEFYDETVGTTTMLIPESIDCDVLWVPMNFPHSVWLVLDQISYHHHEPMKQQIAGQPSNHFLNPSDLCTLLLRKKEFITPMLVHINIHKHARCCVASV